MVSYLYCSTLPISRSWGSESIRISQRSKGSVVILFSWKDSTDNRSLIGKKDIKKNFFFCRRSRKKMSILMDVATSSKKSMKKSSNWIDRHDDWITPYIGFLHVLLKYKKNENKKSENENYDSSAIFDCTCCASHYIWS